MLARRPMTSSAVPTHNDAHCHCHHRCSSFSTMQSTSRDVLPPRTLRRVRTQTHTQRHRGRRESATNDERRTTNDERKRRTTNDERRTTKEQRNDSESAAAAVSEWVRRKAGLVNSEQPTLTHSLLLHCNHSLSLTHCCVTIIIHSHSLTVTPL